MTFDIFQSFKQCYRHVLFRNKFIKQSPREIEQFAIAKMKRQKEQKTAQLKQAKLSNLFKRMDKNFDETTNDSCEITTSENTCESNTDEGFNWLELL